MGFLAGLFPRTLYQVNSPLSGPVKVVEVGDERRLMVGDLVQSVNLGRRPIDHKVWGRLAKLADPRPNLRVLILGLGAGTVAQLLSRRLKSSRIIGVEIDPQIVAIGREFFDLGKLKNLQVVIANARSYVGQSSDVYDFIVVDTYRGSAFPRLLSGPSFLGRLRRILNVRGRLVFNRIFSTTDHQMRLKFRDRLERIFGTVREEVIEGPSDSKNYLYWVGI